MLFFFTQPFTSKKNICLGVRTGRYENQIALFALFPGYLKMLAYLTVCKHDMGLAFGLRKPNAQMCV